MDNIFEKISLSLILLKIFDIYFFCYLATNEKIAITHLWHAIEPQTMYHLIAKDKVAELANLISKLNFYKLIPYPMDNLLNQSAQTGPPNVRKKRPVFPPAGRSVVLCTPQMAPRTSFLSRQPDVIASFSLSKHIRPLVS